jgi:hypothetical protein
MKKRASATSKKTKARRRSMAAPKRRTARAMSRRSSSAAGQETELARLNRERDEVLEQLAGAAEVLKVISSSAGDLKPVFDTILETATRICEAKFGNCGFEKATPFASPRRMVRRLPIANISIANRWFILNREAALVLSLKLNG